MYDYVIVGAGITGCVFAHEMSKLGKKCLVIDKRDHIGGNCYSFKANGIDVHKYGAHIFRTNDRKLYDYLEQFGELVPFVNAPLAHVNGKMYNLPFNMNTFNKLWGVSTPEEAKRIIAKETKDYQKDTIETLEEYALSKVGKDIYELFIRDYTEKQWGTQCSNLPKSIMSDIPIRYTFNNNYYSEKFSAVPKDGYEKLFYRMLENVDFMLGKDALKMDLHSIGHRILYTGKIDEYFKYQYGKLGYRSLRFEHKTYKVENMQGNAVVNYPSMAIPYTRVIEHKNFSTDEKILNMKETVITYEFPEKYDGNNEAYYPINDKFNMFLYNEYKGLADKQEDVLFAGRLGTYEYDSMDVAIEKALALVRKEVVRWKEKTTCL